MQVKITQAHRLITRYIKAGLVPMIQGSPGVGKSAIVHQIAEEYNLKVIDLRLSQCDPTDIMGFPSITGEKASYKPMDTFPIEGDTVPSGYSGWLLFLDEFNSAAPAVQAASYKLVLDREVGQHKLHKNVAIVCAGNRESDGAIVQSMSTALQSRLVHLDLVIDVDEWCNWAMSNGIDHRITSYIKFKPSSLYTFKPDHTDKTYACPRTWAFANRLIDEIESSDASALFSGVLSEGVAREFLQFVRIYEDLPKIEDIIKKPETIAISKEPSVLYAVTGSLAHHINVDNAEAVLKYVSRLPGEFQIVAMKSIIKRAPEVEKTPVFKEWLTVAANKYL